MSAWSERRYFLAESSLPHPFICNTLSLQPRARGTLELGGGGIRWEIGEEWKDHMQPMVLLSVSKFSNLLCSLRISKIDPYFIFDAWQTTTHVLWKLLSLKAKDLHLNHKVYPLSLSLDSILTPISILSETSLASSHSEPSKPPKPP